MKLYNIYQEIKKKLSLYDKSRAIQKAEITAKAAELAYQEKIHFLAKMSHELRTPMNAIMGFTQLSLMSKDKNQDYLEKIYYSSQQLLELINNLLDVSDLESGDLEIDSVVFNLPLILDELNNTAVYLAKNKNINIDICHSSKQQELLKGDPLRLNQILTNLISNAIKFTEKGEVSLTISEIEAEAESNSEKTSLKLCFSVKDTGIGINDAQKEKIQQNFILTDNHHLYNYSGLGLAVTKQLIEKMGGRIQFDSTPGKGSRFYFIVNFLLPSEEETVRYKSTCKADIIELQPVTEPLASHCEMQDLYHLIINFDTRAIDVLDELLKQKHDAIEYQQLLDVSLHLKQYNFKFAGDLLQKNLTEEHSSSEELL